MFNSRVPRTYVCLAVGILALLGLSACESQNDTVSGDLGSREQVLNTPSLPIDQASLPLLTLLQSSYQALSDSATTLNQAVQRFVDKPSLEALNSALAVWDSSHQHYLVSRASIPPSWQHPALDQQQSSPKVIHPIAIRLDQQPMLNGYLDSVEGYPKSGLIHSEIALDRQTLNAEHQFSDPAYVALGFHALEFMLKGDTGDHHSRLKDYLSQNRSNDQQINENSETTEQLAIQRRKQYLTLLAQQIAEDLELLAQAWQAPEGYYFQQLSRLDRTAHQDYLTQIRQAYSQATQRIGDLAEDAHIDAATLSARRQLIQSLEDTINHNAPSGNAPSSSVASDKATPAEKSL